MKHKHKQASQMKLKQRYHKVKLCQEEAMTRSYDKKKPGQEAVLSQVEAITTEDKLKLSQVEAITTNLSSFNPHKFNQY